MYSITVNGAKVYKADLKLTGTIVEGLLNNHPVKGDLVKINNNEYHLIYGGASYNIYLTELNAEEKTVVLKINSMKFSLQLKDKYDELLHKLGLDEMTSKKILDIKAPMPGMVLNILVKEGDHVTKGDALIVLEAMKMENILKAPGDGVIKKISAKKGAAVEKNQLLIQF